MDAEDTRELCNHWWPRAGWRPGRLVDTWHLTFEDAPALHRLVSDYQAALAELPGLNFVPSRWLHLTLQAVGFADEVSEADLNKVTDAVRARLAQREPFKLIFRSANIRGEAIVLQPVPVAPVHILLDDIRQGIADALGPAAVHVAHEQQHGFVPHVSLAYSAIDAPSGPYAAALDAVTTPSVTVQIDRVQLIRQDRLLAPHWQYRWRGIVSAALGIEPPHQSAIAGD